MINVKAIEDALERNKELMEALQARKGEYRAYIIRKASESLVFTQMALPPERAFSSLSARSFLQVILTHAQQSTTEMALRAYEPRLMKEGELSEADAEKIVNEFMSEVETMAKVIAVSVGDTLGALQ